MSLPVRLMHVITDLDVGGAEMMLLKLLSATDPERIRATVVSMLDEGELGPRIEALGIDVIPLRMRRGGAEPGAIGRLARLIGDRRPAVVQTWLYHADLLASLAMPLQGRPVLVWNLRQTDPITASTRRQTRWVARANSLLSHFAPTAIVCGSERAREGHMRMGYSAKRMRVIANGFDLDRFRPDPQRRRRVRAELAIGDHEPVIGLAARFDPEKDHRGFIAAAGVLTQAGRPCVFVLFGTGVDHHNPDLVKWCERAGISGRVRLLGRRDDVEDLYRAMDIMVSSSASEGFANVIGEAMASAVPCVVTDVGDSARIVADTGRVVPPGNPPALAKATAELLDLPLEQRLALGEAARRRIEKHYALPRIAEAYLDLYASLLERRRRR